LDDNRIAVQPADDHIDAALKIGAHAVHLVDETNARHMIFIGLAPDCFRLRLHTGHAVEDDHAAVQHAQTALYFGREVHMPGGIDQVDLVTKPGRGDSRRGDRDAPLSLLLHVIRRGSAIVHLAHAVNLAGVIQDALSRRRLAGVDVGDDADIPDFAQVQSSIGRGFLGHDALQNVLTTSGSVRTPGWPRPYGAYLLFS